MTKFTQTTKQFLFYLACALALGAVAGLANAEVCMKKPYAQSHMTPMPAPGGYYRPMKPYGHPSPPHRHPWLRQGEINGADNKARQQDARISPRPATPTREPADIFETATAAGDFDTLIKAIVVADLYDTLRGEGPFTVFAPTDAAFAKLPEGTLDRLLADKDILAETLSYHVVPGRLRSADLLTQREIKTLQGQKLSINSLSVVKADIETANGVVHVVDAVLMPNP